MEENEIKKDKKSPKKKLKIALIIIAAVIVAAAAAFFAAVKIAPPDSKLNLCLKFIKETHNIPVKFYVDDYDINSKNEAFAFTGKKKKAFLYDSEMWFVSADKCEKITDIEKCKVNNLLTYSGRKASNVYISVEKYDGDDSHRSLLYTADGETYSESVKSGRYRNVSASFTEYMDGYTDSGAEYWIFPDMRGWDKRLTLVGDDYRPPVPAPELIEANEIDFEEASDFITCLVDSITTEDFTKITEQVFFDKYFKAEDDNGTFGSVYSHFLGYDDPIDYKKEPDPENRFKDVKDGLYYKFSAEAIDWITTSVFNFKLSNKVEFSDPDRYYHDGYYYMAPDRYGSRNVAYLLSHEQLSDGKYKLDFEIRDMETTDLVSNLTVIAGLKECEGKNVWCLYSSEVNNIK